MQSASVICDSASPHGHRLTTFVLRFPKFILAEFNTHRVLSRNASSSRAIPTVKLIDEATSRDKQVRPVGWPKNQPGMSADENIVGEEANLLYVEWERAALGAASHAEKLRLGNAHKQVVNRVLEPYLHVNVVASATEWMNFFGLRLARSAQPEMRALAELMWSAYGESKPTPLAIGAWHLPFVDDEDWSQYPQDLVSGGDGYSYHEALDQLRKVSVARCARVSYTSFDQPPGARRSLHDKDVELCDRLVKDGHWSPFEHVATPDAWYGDTIWFHPEEHGNFKGFRQYRKMFDDEAIRPLPEEYRT